MKIWLVTIGEPLPIISEDVRLLRAGMLSEELVSRGHKVIWWTSTFDHSKKQHLFPVDKKIDLSEFYCIYLLHSVGYKKNISVRRVIDHVGVACKFKYYSQKELVPDVIICSMPTLELSVASARYGNKHNVPVILDLRDMWPDIFVNRAPSSCRWLLRGLLAFMFYQIRTVCRKVTAITGITPGYVEWGLQYAGRNRTHFDKDFPMGYSEESPTQEKIKDARSFWQEYDISSNNNDFVVCLFSSMVRQFELETVIDAARRLEKTGRRFRFVFCGRGDALEYFKKVAEGCDTVLFPGWINKPEIWTLMRIAQVGLAPYRSTKDFVISIPNKAIEYMSAGLPVISSLKGTLQKLLLEHEAGVTYENNNEDSLFSLLCDLYDQPEKLQDMSKNAHALFKERFVAEKVYSNMCDYIEQIAQHECSKGDNNSDE
ncbi:MAG: glycosyltransferase family 4 protein [Pseudomonadota bacterium]